MVRGRVLCRFCGLDVAAAAAHHAGALRADLGHGRRPAELELALLVQRRALAARGAALVLNTAGDTLW